MKQSKFHVDDKKLLMRKSSRLHFASSVNSLTLSHSCQEKFSIIPEGSFKQLVGGMGPGDFRQLKRVLSSAEALGRKRGGINFSSSRSCYHCTTDMLAELYLVPARRIIISKVLVRTSVFCFMGFIKSKCRPIE